MIFLQHLLVAWLAIGFPIFDHFATRRLKARPTEAAKISTYRFTITWLWLAAAIAVATRGFDALWGRPEACIPPAILERDFGVVTWILVGMFVLAAVPVVGSRFHAGLREYVAGELAPLAFFVPHSRRTRGWFAAVSVTAGICEEIVYRGFLLAYFCATIGLGFGLSIALSCVIFGVGHAYQGRAGLLMTTVLAFVFFCLYVFTGSLLVPILLHILGDLRILFAPNPRSTEA